MEDSNKKYYFAELKNNELVDTFKALVLENAPVKVWIKGQSAEQAESYSIKNFNSDRMYVALDSKNTLFRLIMSNNRAKNLFFRFGGEKLYTFTTGILVREKGEQRLYLNELVFRCQKRINYRLVTDSYNKMSFKIGDEVLEVFDLSANGVGILISKLDQKRFEKGSRFKNCTVFLNEKSYSIPMAEVVSVWEERTALFKVTGNLEIGIQFRKMSPGEEEKFSRDIHLQAREVEVRKTLLKKEKEDFKKDPVRQS